MADLVQPIYAPLKTVLDEVIPGWRDYVSDPPEDRAGVTLHDPQWNLIGMRTENESLQDLYTTASKEKYIQSCTEASLKYNELIEKLMARNFSAKPRACWDAIAVDFPNGLEIYICPPPTAKVPVSSITKN